MKITETIKDFTYTLKDRETGKIMYQEVTTFGSKKHPFPEDWVENGMIQMSLEEHKEKILRKLFIVELEEGNKIVLK